MLECRFNKTTHHARGNFLFSSPEIKTPFEYAQSSHTDLAALMHSLVPADPIPGESGRESEKMIRKLAGRTPSLTPVLASAFARAFRHSACAQKEVHVLAQTLCTSVTFSRRRSLDELSLIHI